MTDFNSLAEEVWRTKQGRLVQREAEDIVEVRPVTRKKAARVPRGKPFTKDDPLWSVIGIGESIEPTDIATHKDECPE